jgi:hypothetical protein
LTTAAVAFLGWRFAGLPIAAAIALGAIVAPPDAVAANEVLRYLRIPQRIGLVLRGESLLNDATALLICDLHRVVIKVVLFSQPSCVDTRRSADARRAPSLSHPALLNFRSLLTRREHQTPSNSPRARCALRQMTANPSSSCTCTSIRLNADKDER